MIAPEVVFYSPGSSARFSRPLKPPGIRGAWKVIRQFLDECEHVELQPRVDLRVLTEKPWDERTIAEECAARTVERFGLPAFVSRGYVGLIGTEPREVGSSLHWEFSVERFPEARDFLLAGDPWPRLPRSPITLTFSFDFLWRDPDGSGPLPAQITGHATDSGALKSTIHVQLQQMTRVAPRLAFPFACDDPRLLDLLSFIVPILPFHFRPEFLRRGIPTRAGDKYMERRFDTSTLGMG